MASPIGHSLCGCIIHAATHKKSEKVNWKELLIFIILANLADIDYLFGFIVGKPNHYHHQFTHSIGFTLIVAAGLALYSKIKYLTNYVKTFILIFALYGSHVLVDFFAKDTSLPYGEQLFWPFSSSYFISSFSIFRDLHKADSSAVFFPALLSYHNFCTVLTEIVIFGAILILTHVIKNRDGSLN